MAKVILDAGHGGSDAGASYQGRLEKDDVLRLTLAVGDVLSQNGVDVSYTRVNDVYNTPYEKAVMANNSGADLFVSIHRNSAETPNKASGIMGLVYGDEGIKGELARNINEKLSEVGYQNLGVVERPNLVVLRRTQMPAVMVEAGFINNETDNHLFDEKFEQVTRAIADGISETLGEAGMQQMDQALERGEDYEIMVEGTSYNEETGYKDLVTAQQRRPIYRVQVGAFRNYQNAVRFLEQLHREGYPGFIIFQDGLFRVQVGAFQLLDNAIRMEQRLRNQGYNTFITVS